MLSCSAFGQDKTVYGILPPRHFPQYVSLYELNAKAGETYYFVAHVVGGVVSDDAVIVRARLAHGLSFTLSQVNADEGKYLVAQANFNASRPK